MADENAYSGNEDVPPKSRQGYSPLIARIIFSVESSLTKKKILG
jgi:hypothetical protein